MQTQYRVWINQIDDNGNLVVERVVDQAVTGARFEIPTHLSSGTYLTWMQALVREADGQVHRSAWSAAVSTRLSDPPAAYDISEWEAVEYHVQQLIFDAGYVGGDLPEYTLRIGEDRPVQYVFSDGPLPVPAVVFSHAVTEVELTNLDTGQKLTLTESLPRYELWLTDLETNERVLYERDLTESEFTIPEHLAGGQYRAWVRTIVDGDQQSRWSAHFGAFQRVLKHSVVVGVDPAVQCGG